MVEGVAMASASTLRTRCTRRGTPNLSEGIQGWMVKLERQPEGGIDAHPDFLVDFGDLRGHQVV